jgi:NADH-quinone oxidoreductase subunit A
MYAGLAAMALLSALAVAAVWVLARATAVSSDPLVSLPFLSGWEPQEHALSRFHVRWYLTTLVSLAFDVEMLFMYPWTVVVGLLGPKAVVEMFVFLGLLLVAVLWARREGAFRWV